MPTTRINFRQPLLVGLTAGLVLLFAPATQAKNAYVSVIKDGATIRTEPSSKSEMHSEVFTGFPLQCLTTKGDWTEVVDFENDRGWISNTLISPRKSVIVTAKKAKLMEAPNSDGGTQVIAVAKHGVTFTPLESRGEWLKVRHEDGTEGWLTTDQVWPAKPFDSSTEHPATTAQTPKPKANPAKSPKNKSPHKPQKSTNRHH